MGLQNKWIYRICLILCFCVWMSCKDKVEETKVTQGAPQNTKLILNSTSFDSGDVIPDTFSCAVNQQIFPNLNWNSSNSNTKSYVVIMDDPDAKQVVGYEWNHWIIYNIPDTVLSIGEGINTTMPLPVGALMGTSSFKTLGYGGPCPPPGQLHHYHFKLYAMDKMLSIPEGIDLLNVRKEMENHVLDSAVLIGVFQK